MPLNAKQRAALASGMSMEQVLASAELKGDDTTETNPSGDPAADAAALAAAAPAKGDNTAPLAEQLAAAVSAREALTTEVDGLKAQVTALNEQLTAAKAEKEAVAASADYMKSAVATQVTHLSIALGSKVDASAMTPEQLVAAHKDVTEKMKAFPTARVSRTAPNEDNKAATAEAAALMARAKAFENSGLARGSVRGSTGR